MPQSSVFIANKQIRKHTDMKDKIRIAIIGYGNIGHAALQAAQAATDMEVVGIVRRTSSITDSGSNIEGIPVVDDISKLDDVHVAVLCTPTRMVPDVAEQMLRRGISTVDSFDIHTQIGDLRARLMPVAKANNAVSIIAAGWDPGSDSVVRALMESLAPKGLTYTNFGPGMSMGHTVAVKAVEGVKNALSMTIPLGTGVHRHMVYVELKDGYLLQEVAAAIKADPYFANDETHVMQVESADALKDMGHGVLMERKGVSGTTQNQRITFQMSINNPALTGQVLICCARATRRLQPAAYTLIEVPVIDLLQGERDTLVRRLV